MIPKFRAWYGAEMYEEPVIHNGEFYLDWRDFIDGDTYDGAVLMQSTGRFDGSSEPIEIFEEDVAEDEGGRRYVVKKNREFSAFFLYPCDNPEEFMAFYPDITLKVIGNVWEHPDLLEGLNDQ